MVLVVLGMQGNIEGGDGVFVVDDLVEIAIGSTSAQQVVVLHSKLDAGHVQTLIVHNQRGVN